MQRAKHCVKNNDGMNVYTCNWEDGIGMDCCLVTTHKLFCVHIMRKTSCYTVQAYAPHHYPSQVELRLLHTTSLVLPLRIFMCVQ